MEAGGIEPEAYYTEIYGYYSFKILILDLKLDFLILRIKEATN